MAENKYKVSNETASFIDAIRLADELYTKVYDSVVGVYSEEQAEAILGKFGEDKGFTASFERMRAQIGELLLQSIDESLSCSNSTQI